MDKHKATPEHTFAFDWRHFTNQFKEMESFNSELQELSNFSAPVEPNKTMHCYHIEVDDDTHWNLVSIAAKQRLHQEDFVEQLLVDFVAEAHAATAANKVN